MHPVGLAAYDISLCLDLKRRVEFENGFQEAKQRAEEAAKVHASALAKLCADFVVEVCLVKKKAAEAVQEAEKQCVSAQEEAKELVACRDRLTEEVRELASKVSSLEKGVVDTRVYYESKLVELWNLGLLALLHVNI